VHYLNYIRTTLAVSLTLVAGCEKAGRSTGGDPGSRAKRVVALTPSSTEIVAAAGGLSMLVGVDKFSVYPPEVRKLPKVGDFLSPSFEAILSLDPDLVVLDTVQGKVAARLKSAGIATLVLRMHTIEDVRIGLVKVGEAIGKKEAAERTRDQLDRAVDEVRQRAEERASRSRPAVLAVVDRESGGLGGMVAAGPGSFIDELLAILDAANVMAASGIRYSTISAEQILRGQPDVILDSVHGKDPARSLDAWNRLPSVPAVANGRIFAISEPFYMSPGPRLGEALLGLERMVHGSAPASSSARPPR